MCKISEKNSTQTVWYFLVKFRENCEGQICSRIIRKTMILLGKKWIIPLDRRLKRFSKKQEILQSNLGKGYNILAE